MPQGLLSGPPQETRRPSIWDRVPGLGDPQRRARLAMAIEGMMLNPNQAIVQTAQDDLEAAREEERINRTVEWLRSQPGGEQFAAALAAGGAAPQVLGSYLESQQPMSPYEQAQLEYTQAQTENLRNPQMTPLDQARLEQIQAETDNLRQPSGYSLLSEDEARQAGLNPNLRWQRAPNGQITQIDGSGAQVGMVMSGAQANEQFGLQLPEDGAFNITSGPNGIEAHAIGGGGTNVTVNNAAGEAPDDEALRETLMENEGELWGAYLSAGNTAAGMTQDMEALQQLAQVAPQGPVTGRLAQMFPGFSSAGDAFQSIIARVAPTLRAEGSGSTSDVEYAGFLRAMPSLSNSPEANRVIAQMMQAKAQINMDRAEIISRYQDGSITAPEARRQMAQIDNRSIMTPEMRALLEGNAEGGQQPTQPQRLIYDPETGEFVNG